MPFGDGKKTGSSNAEPPVKLLVWFVLLLGLFAAAFVAYLHVTGKG